MLVEVEDAVRSFSRADRDALVAELVVAVTWKSAFLADPGGAVWRPIFAADRGGAAAVQRCRRCRSCGERFLRALSGALWILDDPAASLRMLDSSATVWPDRAQRRTTATPDGWTGVMRALRSAG